MYDCHCENLPLCCICVALAILHSEPLFSNLNQEACFTTSVIEFNRKAVSLVIGKGSGGGVAGAGAGAGAGVGAGTGTGGMYSNP